MRPVIPPAVMAAALLAALPAFAQSPPPAPGSSTTVHSTDTPSAPVPPDRPGGRPWHDWASMSGDWGGARTWLAQRGFEITAEHTADLSSSRVDGQHGARGLRGLTVVGATLDLEALVPHARGWRASVQFMQKGGRDGGACQISAQGFSNIDTDSFAGRGEAWVEGHLAGERLRLKVGRVDANSEFAYVEHGGEFINPSVGVSPTLFLLPTYPEPAASVNVVLEPGGGLYSATGLYNGRPALGDSGVGTPFVIQEAGAAWDSGRLGVGAWHHSGTFERPDGSRSQGTTGTYAVFDQSVWAGINGAGEPALAGVFVQAGWADGEVSEITRHVGVGITTQGLVPWRPRDRAGLAASVVHFGACAATAAPAGRETNVGGFYAVPLAEWLWLKSDLQIVSHPAGRVSGSPAVMGTMRLQVVF
ncbi:MAG: carbohydrate porin [Vicinamibacterales bacterium]